MPWRSRKATSIPLLALAALCSSCDTRVAIQVTTTADGGEGSLRAALEEVNRRTTTALRVEIPSGTYELTLCGADDTNAAGDLDVTSPMGVRLTALGPDVIIRQTCAGERVLDAQTDGQLQLVGVTISGGSAAGNGGGVRGRAVTFTRTVISGNKATVAGGGVATNTLTATDSLIQNNEVDRYSAIGGGGVYATGEVRLSKSEVSNNSAGRGGGVVTAGTLRLSETKLLGNRAGLYVAAGTGYPGPTDGGGAIAHSLEADRVTIANNEITTCGNLMTGYAPSDGPAFRAHTAKLVNVTISGNSSPLSSSCGPGQPSAILVTERLTLEHATIVDNGAAFAIDAPAFTAHRSVARGPYAICRSATAPVASSYNWFADSSCALTGPGDRQEVTELELRPMRDNGGSVPTHVPALTSPLVNAVPAEACPTLFDARGVARPQGQACDIGAVEAVYSDDIGPTSLRLAMRAPASFIAGQGASWTIDVENRGLNSAAPTVRIDVPSTFKLNSVSASGGGECFGTGPIVCDFSLLTPGSVGTITVNGDPDEYVASLTLNASARSPGTPPSSDHSASATAAVQLNAALRLSGYAAGSYVTAEVTNTGPYTALSSADRVITVKFEATPGVGAYMDSSTLHRAIGAYAPSTQPLLRPKFRLWYYGPPPAQVGTLVLEPGPNSVSGPTRIPIAYQPGPDVAVRLRRQPGVFAAGTPIPVTVEVVNVGLGGTLGTRVQLTGAVQSVTWSPTVGTVEEYGSVDYWNVPPLAPGESVELHGVSVATTPSTLEARGTTEDDANYSNNSATLAAGPSPLGTADLQMTNVETRPGAGAGEYVVRVTITNAGPSTYQDPNASAVVHAEQTGFPPPRVTATALTPGWNCASPTSCYTSEPIAVGATAVFDFAVAARDDSLIIAAKSGSAVPDPIPANNTLPIVW